jgi:hypothetical protein
MKKPDMRIKVDIQAIICLKGAKEIFPLPAESTGNIYPKTFNSNVVDTPLFLYQWPYHKSLKI